MSDNSRLRKQMQQYGVPFHLWNGIENYIDHGIRAGSFLNSVLENKFVQAICRADDINLSHLKDIASFVANVLPSNSWGSEEAVNQYIEYVKGKSSV